MALIFVIPDQKFGWPCLDFSFLCLFFPTFTLNSKQVNKYLSCSLRHFVHPAGFVNKPAGFVNKKENWFDSHGIGKFEEKILIPGPTLQGIHISLALRKRSRRKVWDH